ncbi:hypothetical protein VaNZ11_013134 [Volvox africanus]|uniref:Chromo domain-containing protein n=1 Tax=Volvox africanus TaxID=51714 RepID=A0ABQ5SFE8_9CHLO|nr:hypothetical protein VaNZ11_013134 [Volvox africanus]
MWNKQRLQLRRKADGVAGEAKTILVDVLHGDDRFNITWKLDGGASVLKQRHIPKSKLLQIADVVSSGPLHTLMDDIDTCAMNAAIKLYRNQQHPALSEKPANLESVAQSCSGTASGNPRCKPLPAHNDQTAGPGETSQSALLSTDAVGSAGLGPGGRSGGSAAVAVAPAAFPLLSAAPAAAVTPAPSPRIPTGCERNTSSAAAVRKTKEVADGVPHSEMTIAALPSPPQRPSPSRLQSQSLQPPSSPSDGANNEAAPLLMPLPSQQQRRQQHSAGVSLSPFNFIGVTLPPSSDRSDQTVGVQRPALLDGATNGCCPGGSVDAPRDVSPRLSSPQSPLPAGRHANDCTAAETMRTQQAQAVTLAATMLADDNQVHVVTEGATSGNGEATAVARGHGLTGHIARQHQRGTRKRRSREMEMADFARGRQQGVAAAAVGAEEEGASLHVAGDVCMDSGCCCCCCVEHGERAVEFGAAEGYPGRYASLGSAGCQGAEEGGNTGQHHHHHQQQQQQQQQPGRQEGEEEVRKTMRDSANIMATHGMEVVEEQVVMEAQAAAAQTAAVAAAAAAAAVQGAQELMGVAAAVQQLPGTNTAAAAGVEEATAAAATQPTQSGFEGEAMEAEAHVMAAQVAQRTVEAAGAAGRAAYMQTAAARAAAVLAAGVLAVTTAAEDATYLICPFTGRSFGRSLCLKPGDVPLAEQLSDPRRTVAANQDREMEEIVNETFSRRLGSSVFLIKWLGYELDPGEPGGRNGHWVSQAVLESWVPMMLAEWRLRGKDSSRQKSGADGSNPMSEEEKKKEEEKKEEEEEERKEEERKEERKEEKKKEEKKEKEPTAEEEEEKEEELTTQGLHLSWIGDVDISSQDLQDAQFTPPTSGRLDRDGNSGRDAPLTGGRNIDEGGSHHHQQQHHHQQHQQHQQAVEVVPPAGYPAGLDEDEALLDINDLLTRDGGEDPDGWQELLCRASRGRPAAEAPVGSVIHTNEAGDGGTAADPSCSRAAAAAAPPAPPAAAAAIRDDVAPVTHLGPIPLHVDVVGAGAARPGPSAAGPSGCKIQYCKKRPARQQPAAERDKPEEQQHLNDELVFLGEDHRADGRGAGQRILPSQSRRRSARIQAYLESMQSTGGQQPPSQPPPQLQQQPQQPPAKRVALQWAPNGGTAAAHTAIPAIAVDTSAAPVILGVSTATTATVLMGATATAAIATATTATATATNAATATATAVGRRKCTRRCRHGPFSEEVEARLKAEVSSGSFVESMSTGRKYPKSLCCGPKDIRVADYDPDDDPQSAVGAVERIMDEVTDDVTGRRYLLVKWKGYELDPGGEHHQGHWEPVGHVPRKVRARVLWERCKPFWFDAE